MFIDTAVKAAIIDAMIAAGMRHIEATSFVSPRAVPQLADAHEMLARLTRRKEAHIAALVPNARGAERALGAGVDETVCFVSASETHNRANLNASIERLARQRGEVAAIVRGKRADARRGGLRVRLPVRRRRAGRGGACASSTPMPTLGFDALTLGDTTGMATPPTVARLVEAIRARHPELPIALHFHNTRGVGLANVMVGLDLGIREYESSIAGLGGARSRPAPPATSAPRTWSTCSRNRASTPAIDLDALVAVARRVEEVIGRPLPGQVMKAGPRLRSYSR